MDDEQIDVLDREMRRTEILKTISDNTRQLIKITENYQNSDEIKSKDIKNLSNSLEGLVETIKSNTGNFASLMKLFKFIVAIFFLVVLFLGTVIVYITKVDIDIANMRINNGTQQGRP